MGFRNSVIQAPFRITHASYLINYRFSLQNICLTVTISSFSRQKRYFQDDMNLMLICLFERD